MKEIDTKIDELKKLDDPESKQNFAIELSNLVSKTLSKRHEIQEKLEEEFEHKRLMLMKRPSFESRARLLGT